MDVFTAIGTGGIGGVTKAVGGKAASKITETTIGSELSFDLQLFADKSIIKGFTKHGLAQTMGRDGGRGVSNKAILDAVNNPSQIIQQANGTIKYIGKNATVILNQYGKVVTTWARNSFGVRGGN